MGAPGGRGPLAGALGLIKTARALAERAGTHDARAHLAASTCVTHYANGRFRAMIEEFRRMVDHVRSGAPGMVYEESSVRWFAASSLAFLGRFKDLRREQALGYREAVARGDVFASVSMRIGPAVLVWLAEDRPDLAERNAREALAEWSKRGFHFEHYHALVSQAYVRLYLGDAEGAHAVASELQRRTRRSLLWYIELARSSAHHLRAATALAMLDRGLGDRRELLREAERDARGIERKRAPWAQPFAMVTRAGIALHSGRREEAIAVAEKATRAFEAADLLGYAAATRDQRARLLRSPEAATELAKAADYFRAEEIVAPEKMARILVPGLHPE